ncbi:hypothetical protein SARC_01938 [Sphaeroforma arctica JP610]|uniref:SWIM-type domain-containing protein n=1 Tax=Sphaeroforma arctica JP610 TaxID=667725 RepID=A0A0L0GA75_9EUKA|nr:hypothetical protein SARC_01938 [Sphaeroforma arctica JP610]KNC85900.1 hypothetical protein SARC_01938 [Sphaeroforma arctica JP610]|eukprot:XP_014159802.1 hypothetical protein SARC_01938 [Sphaeroforma arctica JP610]
MPLNEVAIAGLPIRSDYHKVWQLAEIPLYTNGAAQVEQNVNTSIYQEAKNICRFKWKIISFGADFSGNSSKDVFVCASIPRSQISSSMEEYAMLTSHLEGEYRVKKDYCVCPLDIGRKCVHVASLVWTVVQQSGWAAANDFERYKYDSSIKQSDDDEDSNLCTSKESKWDVPSFVTGNIDEDV